MLKFNNRTLTYNSRWLNGDEIPINLPANTVRLRYIDGITPTAYHEFPGTTLTQISSIPNIWDITHWDPQYPGEWHYLFDGYPYGATTGYGYGYGLLEVMAANVSNITNMTGAFGNCFDLYKVCNLNTSKCTDFSSMFNGCRKLVSVGTINTSKASITDWMFNGCENLIELPSINLSQIESMAGMFVGCPKLSVIPNITLPAYTYANRGKIEDCHQLFDGCYNISSGALDLYNRLTHTYYLSGQTCCLVILKDKLAHQYCFRNCGRDTVTGAAELAQIPSDWK